MNDDRTPDLLPVIQWLEAGCDPKHAAAELRIYAERLAALSAAPAQEPVAWRGAMQQALNALEMAQAGLEWYRDAQPENVNGSDEEADEVIGDAMQVLRDALSASPLPQEPQEGKELTDAASLVRACAPFLKDGETPAECIARNRKDAEAVFLYYGDAQKWRAVREQLGEIETEFVRLEDLPSWIRKMQDSLREARAIERELRAAQEGKAGDSGKSLNALAADLLRPYLKPGQKVIWREAFRWHDDNGVLPNHYDGMEIPALAEAFGYDWEYDFDFKHAAIVWKKDAVPPPSATLAASREGEQR